MEVGVDDLAGGSRNGGHGGGSGDGDGGSGEEQPLPCCYVVAKEQGQEWLFIQKQKGQEWLPSAPYPQCNEKVILR